tara:strand:- start:1272 stop:1895 length:624 start_codon:yes stop_codon:yes gene_type:complete
MTILKKLYVDLDDVIGETAVRLLEISARDFGRNVAFEDVISYNLEEVLKLSDTETEEFYLRSNSPEVLKSLAPRANAVDGLTVCQKNGFEVWIVTGRPAQAYRPTQDWLAEFAVPYDELLFVNKFGLPYKGDGPPPVEPITLDTLADINFFAAIEDHLGMARFVAERMQIQVLLMDRPWNRDVGTDLSPLIHRCYQWPDVLQTLGIG